MRRMYSKSGAYEIYLHAYEQNNPEIELNLKFRNYLIENPNARKEYSKIKKNILEQNTAPNKLTSTGITAYNLGKNEFIQRIIKESGFDGLCIRLCTQENEWKEYENIISNVLHTKELSRADIKDPTQKNLVLYRGTQIVAAARMSMAVHTGFIELVASHNNNLEYKSQILRSIEKWAKKSNIPILNVAVAKEEYEFYKFNKYLELDAKFLIYMAKCIR